MFDCFNKFSRIGHSWSRCCDSKLIKVVSAHGYMQKKDEIPCPKPPFSPLTRSSNSQFSASTELAHPSGSSSHCSWSPGVKSMYLVIKVSAHSLTNASVTKPCCIMCRASVSKAASSSVIAKLLDTKKKRSSLSTLIPSPYPSFHLLDVSPSLAAVLIVPFTSCIP